MEQLQSVVDFVNRNIPFNTFSKFTSPRLNVISDSLALGGNCVYQSRIIRERIENLFSGAKVLIRPSADNHSRHVLAHAEFMNGDVAFFDPYYLPKKPAYFTAEDLRYTTASCTIPVHGSVQRSLVFDYHQNDKRLYILSNSQNRTLFTADLETDISPDSIEAESSSKSQLPQSTLNLVYVDDQRRVSQISADTRSGIFTAGFDNIAFAREGFGDKKFEDHLQRIASDFHLESRQLMDYCEECLHNLRTKFPFLHTPTVENVSDAFYRLRSIFSEQSISPLELLKALFDHIKLDARAHKTLLTSVLLNIGADDLQPTEK